MISVIIPAHNEGSVIARTLTAMLAGANPGELDVVVVCNGCTDDTAAVAAGFGTAVRVIETTIAGKAHALNLGDAAARSFPRIYADADVILTADAIRALATRLKRGDVLVVAPISNVDLSNCSWTVRAFYEIRLLLPSAREGIGGSGVYGLSKTGRSCFGEFPILIADDGYVRLQFQPHQRETLTTVQSIVFPPRTLESLLATKTRAHYGSFELKERFPKLWKNRGESNDKSLLRLCTDPRLWLKLAVYCSVTIAARQQARRRMRSGKSSWHRDLTSRALA